MALANEIYTVAELTGIARAELEFLEEQPRSASLAPWLPNERVESMHASYHTEDRDGEDVARYRALDAAPEGGSERGGIEKSVRLAPVSHTLPISEETTVNLRSRSDEAFRAHARKSLKANVRAVYNRVNLQRAHVLRTGRAVVNQDDFKLNDDFGRHGDLTTAVANAWTDPSVSRLSDLLLLAELYNDHAGEAPGAIVTTSKVVAQLVRGDEFAVSLANGSERRGNQAEVFGFLQAAGLPPVIVMDSKVGGRSLLGETGIYMLPAPVGNESPEDTELGSTVWGLTATALADGFGIEESDLPGIVAGVYAPTKVPFIHETFADSVNLPILKNPDLSLYAEVL